MEWFNGTVTEALSNYQVQNGILVVYVHHAEVVNNENTTKFNELWQSFDKDILRDIPVVAIRLVNDSEGALQFAQFFPTPVFPVCYVIGLHGQPLEVVTPVEELTVERLNASLRKSIGLYRDQLKEQGIPTTTTTSNENTSSEATVTNATNTTDASSNEANVDDNTSDANLEERIRYARERLEEKRKTDNAKKEEEARLKEIQRRNEGKLLSDARERNKERELREIAEACRREKEADNQALKALREQIRRDKEERAKKAANVSTEEVVLESKQPEPVINKPVDVDECRIQCKFPNGTTLVKTFPSKGPLKAVFDAVKEDGRLSGDFFFMQTYPRRPLNDLDQTLLELGLTPSSALLVVSKDGSPSHRKILLPSSTGTGTGYLQLLFGFFYTPLMSFFQFITNILGIGNTPAVTNRPTPSNEQKRTDVKESVRREGNIGRLRNESDSSDTEGTWNGNSTQQL